MIDFIKILVINPNTNYLKSVCDFYYGNVNPETGEMRTINKKGKKVVPSQTANFDDMEVKIYDTGITTISGSLHKYWNCGAHNYNDFTQQQAREQIIKLIDKLNLNPDDCKINTLEVGVNITPPVETGDILDNCLLHKTKGFEHKYNSRLGNYKQAVHSKYIVKIYDKAKHYRGKGFIIDQEIMRFEIKYTALEKLSKFKIRTLSDLLKCDFEPFKNELLQEWDNVLFYEETLQTTELKKNSYSSLRKWQELIKNRLRFYRLKNDYKKAVATHSENMHLKISKLIAEKFDKMNAKKPENLKNENDTNCSFNYTCSLYHDTTKQTDKKVEVENEKKDNSRRLCIVTGLNISMQKEQSLLLSHTGLKYYKKTSRGIFTSIERKFLTKTFLKSDEETQIKEIAHAIRNKHERIKKRRQPENQTTLF